VIPEIAAIALKEVGVREEGGNNCGPRVREYQEATWLTPGPWPWCAAFVDWCVREWVSQIGPKDLVFGKWTPEAWRPRTAGAFDLEKWAKDRKLPVLGPKSDADPGDIVVFDMSHCGIIVGDHPANSLFLETVEGNTGSQNQRDGDGVWRKKRSRTMVRSIIRIR